MENPADIAIFAQTQMQAASILKTIRAIDYTGESNCVAYGWGSAVVGMRFHTVLVFIPEDPQSETARNRLRDYYNTVIRCSVALGGRLLRFPDWPTWLDTE